MAGGAGGGGRRWLAGSASAVPLGTTAKAVQFKAVQSGSAVGAVYQPLVVSPCLGKAGSTASGNTVRQYEPWSGALGSTVPAVHYL